jgi:hypothetical protein
MLPRAAELNRRQVALGLAGHADAILKGVFLREWFGGKIRLEPLPDGGLMDHWNQNVGALCKGLGVPVAYNDRLLAGHSAPSIKNAHVRMSALQTATCDGGSPLRVGLRHSLCQPAARIRSAISWMSPMGRRERLCCMAADRVRVISW